MNVKVIAKDAFQIIGIKRSYSLNSDENLREIPLLWKEVNSNGTTDDLASRNDGLIKGILGVCAEAANTEHKMDYWIAVSTKQKETHGYEALTIPAANWAVFEVHGPMPASIQKVWKQIYTEWFPSSGYIQAGTVSLEVYGEGNPADLNYYSEIWIPVK
ncbi:MAG: GyrI-like domain-containing protein [Bacillus sp. (in: firmicutes)]